jgi:hypothetical protein
MHQGLLARICQVHENRGLTIEDMVKSRWIYPKLRGFRAGIEADISCPKRTFGLARCTWRGLAHFKAYVWPFVVEGNLLHSSDSYRTARRGLAQLGRSAPHVPLRFGSTLASQRDLNRGQLFDLAVSRADVLQAARSQAHPHNAYSPLRPILAESREEKGDGIFGI